MSSTLIEQPRYIGSTFYSFSEFEGGDDGAVAAPPEFFVALAGQTSDVVLLSGSATDKLVQAGH